MRIQCSRLFQKEILRTIKQCKNKLKKREKWLHDSNFNLQTPLKELQIRVTPQMTFTICIFKKSILSLNFILKKYVYVPFNKEKSLHGYIDNDEIFGIISSC